MISVTDAQICGHLDIIVFFVFLNFLKSNEMSILCTAQSMVNIIYCDLKFTV